MGATATPLDDLLGPLLGRAHMAHRAVTERELADLGISPKQYGALAILAAEGPMSQGRLGERQGVDRTTMVAVVDGLVRRGLVARRRDARDRRAYALEATPAGHRVLRSAEAAVRRAEEAVLAGVSEPDRRRLKELLRRITAAPPA